MIYYNYVIFFYFFLLLKNKHYLQTFSQKYNKNLTIKIKKQNHNNIKHNM